MMELPHPGISYQCYLPTTLPFSDVDICSHDYAPTVQWADVGRPTCFGFMPCLPPAIWGLLRACCLPPNFPSALLLVYSSAIQIPVATACLCYLKTVPITYGLNSNSVSFGMETCLTIGGPAFTGVACCCCSVHPYLWIHVTILMSMGPLQCGWVYRVCHLPLTG